MARYAEDESLDFASFFFGFASPGVWDSFLLLWQGSQAVATLGPLDSVVTLTAVPPK